MTKIKKIQPRDIETESFRIIASELGQTDFTPEIFKVVQRVIHATGDFAFAQSLRFHPGAVKAGIEAVRSGKNILVDVGMGAAGISGNLLRKWGGAVDCRLSEPELAEMASQKGRTRSEVAMEIGLAEGPGIVVVGNAPTALIRALAVIPTLEKSLRPRLVVGVPVGFVNAAESKELLQERDYPFITCLGRKGGSGVAAAIVNALIRLAGEK